jgi:hypothetical protein
VGDGGFGAANPWSGAAINQPAVIFIVMDNCARDDHGPGAGYGWSFGSFECNGALIGRLRVDGEGFRRRRHVRRRTTVPRAPPWPRACTVIRCRWRTRRRRRPTLEHLDIRQAAGPRRDSMVPMTADPRSHAPGPMATSTRACRPLVVGTVWESRAPTTCRFYLRVLQVTRPS